MSKLLGPQQAVIITSRAEIEQFGKKIVKDDIETIFWHMPVSKEELLYAISVPKRKFIYNIIKESGIFVVNFIGFDLQKEVHKCNLIHGEHIDKFKEIGFRKKEAEAIECPVIEEACGYLECKVIESKEFSDYCIFTAKIINSNVKNHIKRLFHLQNNLYTTTKDI